MKVSLSRWAAWAPGIDTPEAWTAWANTPVAIGAEGVPDASFLPAMLRRRCTPLTRTMLAAVYRCLEALFDGRNPYLEAIDRNVEFLERVLRSESWRMLRRHPPLTTASPDTMSTVRTLVVGTVTKSWLPE